MKKHIIGSFAITAAAALALTGCGSAPATNGSTAGSDADASTTQAGYSLIEDGVLTVGTEGAYEPFEYYQDGEITGFDIDLIKAVADELDLEVDYQVVEFDTIIPGVSSGTKYDVGIAGITVTPERAEEIEFTDSYYMDDQAIVTATDNTEVTEETYADALNAEGIKIAAQSGTTSESFIRENFPNATVVTFAGATDCFAALQAGQVDALVTNRSVGAQLIASSFTTCHVIEQISTGEEYAIAVNQDNPELTAAINEALDTLSENGIIDALMEQYNIK